MDKKYYINKRDYKFLLIVFISLFISFNLKSQVKPEGCTIYKMVLSEKKTFKLVKKVLKEDEQEFIIINKPNYIEVNKKSTLPYTLEPNYNGWVIKSGIKLQLNSKIWIESESELVTKISILVNQTSFDIKNNEVIIESKKEKRNITSEVELMEKLIEKGKELNLPIYNTTE